MRRKNNAPTVKVLTFNTRTKRMNTTKVKLTSIMWTGPTKGKATYGVAKTKSPLPLDSERVHEAEDLSAVQDEHDFVPPTSEIDSNKRERQTAGTSTGNCESDETTYAKRRRMEAEAWADFRFNAVSVDVEQFGPAGTTCSFCQTETKEIVRCRDCGPRGLYCNTCDDVIHSVVLWHQSHVWVENPGMFLPKHRQTLLQRADDHSCSSTYKRPLVVFDTLGRHIAVTAVFCGCESDSLTLLRYGLWPSTPTRPESAFTCQLMELCRSVQVEGQISMHKFCAALEGQQHFLPGSQHQRPGMYRSLISDALTEYRHHHQAFLESISAPETLAKGCPVCIQKPQQSVMSMDANFGLVHKKHSGKGAGLENSRHGNKMFSDDLAVHDFVENHLVSKAVPSECSNFQAGNLLRSKNKTEKLDIFGVFGSVCQHGFPGPFLNMRHSGEKYGYPVYILKQLSETRALGEGKATVMYDIACLLQAHMKKHAQLKGLGKKYEFVVPVFHSFAHSTSCQLEFGQRFAEGTGLIDGEVMERLWAYLRKFSYMTKEMTLPNRQDLLTDALLNFTRRNFYTLAEKLVVRLKKAQMLQRTSMTVIQVAEAAAGGGHAGEWLQQWKLIVKSQGKPRVSLSTTEQYCSTLVSLEEKRMELSGLQEGSAKADCEATVKRLSEKAALLKGKLKLKQAWSASMERVQKSARLAEDKKKAAVLAKGRKLAVERQHLRINLKKYADGQKIAARLSKKEQGTFQRAQGVVSELRDLGITTTPVAVLSPTSPLYAASYPLSNQQIEAATAYAELQRAMEEEKRLCDDAKSYLHFLVTADKTQHSNSQEKDSSKGPRFKAASTHLCLYMKFLVEKQIRTLETLFAQQNIKSDCEFAVSSLVARFVHTEPIVLTSSVMDDEVTWEPATGDLVMSDISDISDDDEYL